MEDLDPPREEPGAAQRILHTLQCHGLHWDEPVLWQSRRRAAYARARQRLAARGCLFRWDCTRAALGAHGACRGRCQPRQASLRQPSAVRIRVPPDCHIAFEDLKQGLQCVALGRETPDFVVLRKDALDAYQLAVAVDDAAQAISHVVRGADLLDSTARQIFVQQQLDFPTPRYCHLPVITDARGHKLSKQRHAPALDDAKAVANLRCALHLLGQRAPPAQLSGVEPVLAFAAEHWQLARVPHAGSVAAAAAHT